MTGRSGLSEPGCADGTSPSRLIRLLSWNVHKCLGTDGRRDPDRVLASISTLAPDVAVLQEADLKFGRKRGLLDPDRILQDTGMQLWRPAPSPRGEAGWLGNALLAREGIECHSVKTIKLPSLEPRGAAVWTLRADGTRFDVIGMHLGLVGAFRRFQIVLIAAEIASRPPVPTIVAGDSNDWRWGSPAMRPLEAVLGTRAERPLTFPSRLPVLALDRVLAGRGATAESLSALRAGKVSDHLPLLAEIRLAA